MPTEDPFEEVDQVPPPRASPKPTNLVVETPSGVHRAVSKDINLLKYIQVGVVVAALGIFFGAWRAVAADAKDAGVAAAAESMREAKAASEAAAAVQRELARFEVEASLRADRMEAGQNRGDLKLDAVLTALQVRNPAPTPKDGGR